VRLVSNQAKKQKGHVNIEQPGASVDIYVDPEETQQVFLNIMVSALHDMPDGGMLHIDIMADTEHGEIKVSFTDSGAGIPQEDIEAAFEPVIASGRSSRGLGLGISRRLAEHNGGRITVENRATGGAIYTVILPMKGEHV
jgi:signal transduction histidine kinase